VHEYLYYGVKQVIVHALRWVRPRGKQRRVIDLKLLWTTCVQLVSLLHVHSLRDS